MKYSVIYQFKVNYGLMTVGQLSRPPEDNMEVIEGWMRLIFEDDVEIFTRWLNGHYQKFENKSYYHRNILCDLENICE